MTLPANIRTLTKTVAVPATPEVIAAAPTRFSDIKLIGQKGFETANAGDVFLQVRDATGAFVDLRRIAPNDEVNVVAPHGTFYLASEFQIRVLNAGDGVRCEYTDIP